ncbi:MAG: hypothetical protein WDO15_07235 [Bacteroidota bacterium]
MIRAVLEDEGGHLWISTNKGLSKFNPIGETFRNYTMEDGLQGNIFKPGAAHETRDGWLYFGGANGLNSFHPDSLRDNTFVPPVFFTDFKLFNNSVKVNGPDSILHETYQHGECDCSSIRSVGFYNRLCRIELHVRVEESVCV